MTTEVNFRVTTRFSFAGDEDDGTLSFTRGENLVVTKIDPATGWYFGEDRDGRGGWIPTNLVSKVNQEGICFSDVEAAELDALIEEGACSGCRMSIGSEDYVEASGGHAYHEDCFVCSVCEANVLEQGFVESQGQIYCPECYKEGFTPTCGTCKQHIVGKYLKALDQEFHSACFVCATCQEPFPDLKYHRYENSAYCKRDFMAQHSLKCLFCVQPIEGDMFEALQGFVHPQCFVCAVGKHSLGEGDEFHEHGGALYCASHFVEKVLEKCQRCEERIRGEYVLLREQQAFHMDCFKCSECNKKIQRSLFDVVNGQVYCISCGKKEKSMCFPSDSKFRMSRASAAKTPEAKERIRASRAVFGNLERKVAHIFTQEDAYQSTGTDDIDESALKVYRLEQLTDTETCPSDVLMKHRELHLSDEEFEQVFRMNKASFKLLKFWKQRQLKQRFQLF